MRVLFVVVILWAVFVSSKTWHENSDRDHEVKEQYTRSPVAYGEIAFKEIQNLRVVVVGLSELAVEITRHLLLSNIQQISFINTTSNFDVYNSDGFFSFCFLDNSCTEKEKQKSLDQLNRGVHINTLRESEIEEKIENFDLVVVTEGTFDDIQRYNEICRNSGKKFISVNTLGSVGSLFVDFGDDFEVVDVEGKQQTFIDIAEVKINEKFAEITTMKNNSFYETQHVFFEKVTCAPFLNTNEYIITTKSSETTFNIALKDNELPAQLNTNVSGCRGLVSEIKNNVNFNLSFVSFENSLEDISLVHSTNLYAGAGSVNKAETMHLIFCAVLKFQKDNNRWPTQNDFFDIEQISKELASEHEIFSSNLDIIGELSYLFSENSVIHQGHDINTFFGSLTAQEIIKSTGLYRPIEQWFHYDLGVTQGQILSPHETRNISNLHVVLVGAGATGNEIAKLSVMKGVKNITIIDNDHVVASNLNRQFCYSEEDAAKKTPKSVALKNCLEKRFDDLEIRSFVEFVGPATEYIFDHEFWGNVDVVIAAVDNVEARKYLSDMAFLFNIPMLECGTNNQIGGVHLIIPEITEPYQVPKPKSEGDVSCTVKDSPQTPAHCIHWTKDRFSKYFVDYTTKCNDNDRSEVDINRFGHFLTLCTKGNNKEMIDFLRVARIQFEIEFNEDIQNQQKRDLQESFMRPIMFDSENVIHRNYIWSFMNILASISNTTLQNISDGEFTELFTSDALDISFDARSFDFDVYNGEHLVQEQLIIPQFEKDENLENRNYHLDFVYYSSVLRAQNFNITGVTRTECLKIAGRVDPAVSIVSAAVTSLLSVEFEKFLSFQLYPEKVPQDSLRNYYLDLKNLGSIYIYQVMLGEKMESNAVKLPEDFRYDEMINISIGSQGTIREILDILLSDFFSKYNLGADVVEFTSVRRYGDENTVIFQIDSYNMTEFNIEWNSKNFQNLLDKTLAQRLRQIVPHQIMDMTHINLIVTCVINSQETLIPVVHISWTDKIVCCENSCGESASCESRNVAHDEL